MNDQAPTVTLLSGGGGGAKLADGLARATPRLTVVANTADDDVLYGLHVSPDVDTVIYTLAGLIDPDRGWGLAGDSSAVLDALSALGEDTWFHLGDRDLATHIVRTRLLREGLSLTAVTARLRTALGVPATVLPMTDGHVATRVTTSAGTFAFQEYFVGRGHRDDVLGITIDGRDDVQPARGVLPALTDADVVVIGPSNPFVSIGPILAVPGVREALAQSPARRVAVSPIVGGGALKGPAGGMLATLGHEVSALGVARLYTGLVDSYVLDEQDAHLAGAVEDLGMRAVVTATVMADVPGRERLARELLTAVR